MTQLAKELKSGLYKAITQDGIPLFNTIAKVLDNLGYQLSVKQKMTACPLKTPSIYVPERKIRTC